MVEFGPAELGAESMTAGCAEGSGGGRGEGCAGLRHGRDLGELGRGQRACLGVLDLRGMGNAQGVAHVLSDGVCWPDQGAVVEVGMGIEGARTGWREIMKTAREKRWDV